MKTYKYRIYPGKKASRLLKQAIEDSRIVYNALLDIKKTAYQRDKTKITQFEAQNLIPNIRKEKSLSTSVLILRFAKDRLFDAYNHFFKQHNSFPRFKSKERYRSIGLYKGQYRLDGNTITIPKIGSIPIVLHREYQGDPKQIVIKVSPTGKWYLSICCENVPRKKLKKTNKQIGIDLGLKTFAVCSDGTTIERERFFAAEQDALAKEQQILAKKTKGSKERDEARKKVARVFERISFKRGNFVHQRTKRLLDEYDGIVVEDLNIRSMQKKQDCETKKDRKARSRSIQDVAWRQFITTLVQKAESATNRKVVMIDPKNTSQICSSCGSLLKKRLKLKDRVFSCPSCKAEMDRDLNAAKNIYRSGATLL